MPTAASTRTVICGKAGLIGPDGTFTDTTGLSAAQTLPLQISPAPQTGAQVPELARQIPATAQ